MNTIVNLMDRTVSGSITATNGAVQLSLEGRRGCSVSVSGTWSATLVAEVTADGANWVQTSIFNPSTLAISQTITSNGTYQILGIGGMKYLRIRASSYGSGPISLVLRTTIDNGLTIPRTPPVWSLWGLLQGPGSTTTRVGVSGQSHYICGVQVSINGTATGDSYISYGIPPGTRMIGWYGPISQSFYPPLQVPQGQQVNLAIENSATGNYFNVNLWGYTE